MGISVDPPLLFFFCWLFSRFSHERSQTQQNKERGFSVQTQESRAFIARLKTALFACLWDRAIISCSPAILVSCYKWGCPRTSNDDPFWFLLHFSWSTWWFAANLEKCVCRSIVDGGWCGTNMGHLIHVAKKKKNPGILVVWVLCGNVRVALFPSDPAEKKFQKHDSR